jgi:flap endonuclease-1
MGIGQFFQIVLTDGSFKNKPIGALAREVTFPKLKNMRCCVDASGMIYSSILGMQHIDALTDSEGNTTSHINTIFAKVLLLDKNSISQIWVFDSPIPNQLKAVELKARNERAYNSTDPKVQFRMQSKHVNDIKTLLTLMGIPWIEAPEGIEAEQYGAWMTRGNVPAARFCQYMLSGDSDVLAFGGNLLRPYQKPSATGKSKRTVYQIYELSDILQETGLTYEQFLTMSVAMGTDFCDKTAMVGPKTVISRVKDDRIIKSPEQQKVVDYFKSQPPRNDYDAHFSEFDKDGLVKFLVGRNFNEARINERLIGFPKVL